MERICVEGCRRAGIDPAQADNWNSNTVAGLIKRVLFKEDIEAEKILTKMNPKSLIEEAVNGGIPGNDLRLALVLLGVDFKNISPTSNVDGAPTIIDKKKKHSTTMGAI